MARDQVGVTITLDEIYDVARAAAAGVTGARQDIQHLRGDVNHLAGRVDALERRIQSTATPAYLKRFGYALGIIVTAAASAWTTAHGG